MREWALVGRRGELARLTEVMAASERGPQVVEVVGDPGVGKSRLLDEVRTRAVVVDDLHLGVAGLPVTAPVVVVGYRPRQMGPAAWEWLRGLVGDRTRIELGPLSAGDAGKLVDRKDVVEVSGGNPGYLRMLAEVDGPVRVDMPDIGTTRGPLFAEVAGVTPAALRVAQAAAVAGCCFDAELVAVTADVGRAETEALLDELRKCDLIRGDSTLRFRHPVVRWTVYRTAGVGWRLGAHVRALAVLQKRNAPVAELAWHAQHTGGPGAVAVLTQAAEQAEPERAVLWYDAAIRLAANDRRLLAGQASALVRAGQFARCRDLLQRIPELAGMARLGAIVDNALGRHGEACALLEAELRRDPGAVSVAGDLAFQYVHSRQWDRVERLADRVLADEAACPADRGRASAALAIRAVSLGNVHQAQRHLDNAVAGNESVPLAWAQYALEHDAGALRSALSSEHVLPDGRQIAAMAAIRLGRLQDAASHARMLAADNDIGHVLLAEIALWRRDIKAARKHAAQVKALPDLPGWRGVAEALAGWVLLAGGDADGLAKAMNGLVEPGREVALTREPRWCALAVEAEVALGRIDRARWWAERAEVPDLPGATAYADLADARIALAAGHPEDARLLAKRAAEGFAIAGWPLAEKQAHGVLDATPGTGLSNREHQVAQLVGLGHSNREIAQLLVLSPRTVEIHVAQVLRKLGVRTRAAVAARLRP